MATEVTWTEHRECLEKMIRGTDGYGRGVGPGDQAAIVECLRRADLDQTEPGILVKEDLARLARVAEVTPGRNILMTAADRIEGYKRLAERRERERNECERQFQAKCDELAAALDRAAATPETPAEGHAPEEPHRLLRHDHLDIPEPHSGTLFSPVCDCGYVGPWMVSSDLADREWQAHRAAATRTPAGPSLRDQVRQFAFSLHGCTREEVERMDILRNLVGDMVTEIERLNDAVSRLEPSGAGTAGGEDE